MRHCLKIVRVKLYDLYFWDLLQCLCSIMLEFFKNEKKIRMFAGNLDYGCCQSNRYVFMFLPYYTRNIRGYKLNINYLFV